MFCLKLTDINNRHLLQNSYLPNVCGKRNFTSEHFVCGTTAGSAAFAQKLGTTFFITNNSKIFKDKI
jgi:hypothetical protein